MVIKPHPSTPRCAAALVDVLLEAGAPEGSLGVVVDDRSVGRGRARGSVDAGAALVSSGEFAEYCGSTAPPPRSTKHWRSTPWRKGPLARLVAETGGLNVPALTHRRSPSRCATRCSRPSPVRGAEVFIQEDPRGG